MRTVIEPCSTCRQTGVAPPDRVDRLVTALLERLDAISLDDPRRPDALIYAQRVLRERVGSARTGFESHVAAVIEEKILRSGTTPQAVLLIGSVTKATEATVVVESGGRRWRVQQLDDAVVPTSGPVAVLGWLGRDASASGDVGEDDDDAGVGSAPVVRARIIIRLEPTKPASQGRSRVRTRTRAAPG